MNQLSLHILDIIQNSIRAEATIIQLVITENSKLDQYVIEITDNGCGMDESTLEKVIDPFFTTRSTRKVGLGVSLFKQNAEQTGGSLTIESNLGYGCKLKAVFSLKHIDRQPLGDISGTMTLLIGANPQIQFIYNHETNLGIFEFDTNEVKEEIGKIPINNPDILKALKELIEENIEMIEASA